VLKSIALFGVLTVAMLGGSAPLAAQSRSGVSSTDLESAVITAPAPNQAAVQQFLQDERVIGVASSMGVSAADLANRVSTLDESTLSQVAERTRAADFNLAGGDQTIVLGTTAILLIIIIVILLAS
jgi:hypothetical protein